MEFKYRARLGIGTSHRRVEGRERRYEDYSKGLISIRKIGTDRGSITYLDRASEGSHLARRKSKFKI